MEKKRLARSDLLLATGLLMLLSPLQLLNAQEPPLPHYGPNKHLGVVNCAGNTCHGAPRAYENAAVLQNEYVTWNRQDSHANAYNVLLNDESKRIARNLGLTAAHEAKICLDCHADNVPPERRGERFQLEEGVSCEACHGGAENWVLQHVTAGNSHQQNLDAGLYPTEDPIARAKLCLSCHYGDSNKFVTHRIMGAGHPRMSFELDTFTAIQPAHYQVDDDYKQRKPYWNGVQTWAIGQAVAVETMMENLLDPKLHQDAGIFPELVFFDCFACHHSLNDIRWGPRKTTGLGPGVVRLNDANLLMLQQIMQRVAPDIGNTLRSEIRNLHQATAQGMPAARQVAQRVLSLARTSQNRLAQHQFSTDDMIALLGNMVTLGLQGEQRDYAVAEQGAMAISSLINTLDAAGQVSANQRSRLEGILDKLYAALGNEDNYKPQQFIAALKPLQSMYR